MRNKAASIRLHQQGFHFLEMKKKTGDKTYEFKFYLTLLE